MTIKFFLSAFAAFLLLFQPLSLFGQSAPAQSGWEAVQALSAETKILVETKDGKRLKGNLKNVSPIALALTRSGKTTDLNKENIRRVYQFSGGSRGKSTLIGTAVGAGVGAGASLILLGSTGGSDDFSGILRTGIAIGAGIGAVTGLLLGKNSRRVLVYESN